MGSIYNLVNEFVDQYVRKRIERISRNDPEVTRFSLYHEVSSALEELRDKSVFDIPDGYQGPPLLVPPLLNLRSQGPRFNPVFYKCSPTIYSELARDLRSNTHVIGVNCSFPWTRIDDAGVEAFALTISNPDCRLQELDLDSTNHTQGGLRLLADALSTNRNLRVLNLPVPPNLERRFVCQMLKRIKYYHKVRRGISKGIEYGIGSVTGDGYSPKHLSPKQQERFRLARDPLADKERGIASYLAECIPLDIPSIKLSSYVGMDDESRGKFCLVTVPDRFHRSSNEEILRWLCSNVE